ncbi:MAG: arabinosyltransferase domain-containing protein [Gaiellaceae bacterium]
MAAAIGPAHERQATYAWPSQVNPDVRAQSGWYAPLPLANRVPASLDVRVPCGLSPALRPGRATVLATARKPDAQALRITLAEQELRISAGDRTLARIRWPASCPLLIRLSRGKLRVHGTVELLQLPTLGQMPVVTGLFSTLDIRRGSPPRVVVQTRPFRTSFTVLQDLAAAFAMVLAVAALGLVSAIRPRVPSLGMLTRRVWSQRDVTDLVVVGTLFVWWIVAPIFTDDGWVWAEDRLFGSLGGVGALYDVWGLMSPTGQWLEWLRHWVVGSTNDIIVMRTPSLAALLVAWPFCRWALRMAIGESPPFVVRWTLAGAFLVGATAWEMTVRPEPFISLIAVAVLCAVLSFVRSPRVAPLAIAAPLVIMAITAHPAGITAGAPLLAAVPGLVGWLRAGRSRAGMALIGIVLSTAALGLVLFVVNADIGLRLASANAYAQAAGHREPPWHEYVRYQIFDSAGGGNAGRRLSLALLIVAAAAWVLRSRRAKNILVEPARSVAISLVLLAFVTSKWPWHFGTLAALGSVAVAAEAARLLRAPRSSVRIAVSLLVVSGALLWAWRAPDGWSPLDLQRQAWSQAFNLRVLTALVVIACAATVVGVRRAHKPVAALFPGMPSAILAAGSLAVVGLTIAVLAVDAARSPWTLARQNLDALGGRTSCGIANHLGGDLGIARRLAAGKPTLLAPAVAPYIPCATLAGVRGGVLEQPSLFAYQGDSWPVTELDRPFAAFADLYRFETLARGPVGVTVQKVDMHIAGFRRLAATRLK